MKKIAICVIMLFLIASGTGISRQSVNKASNAQQEDLYNITMKRDIFCVMMGYPEYVTGVERDNTGNVFLVLKSGKRILYDDKRVKGFEEKLNSPDIQDMMEQLYPLYDISGLMKENFDPGRARNYALLKEVYGGSKEKVEANLTNIRVGYKNCQFNKNNNAAKALSSVMQELVPMCSNNSNISRCLFPSNGTFNYRYISGTNRLSPHAFGTAIDLASDKRDYWKWASRSQGEARLKTYSREVVNVFEKHNFIWGGKWGHFDILHFEYRPEIIYKAKYFANQENSGEMWYEGVHVVDNQVKKCIELIEAALK
jgi:hypothetical protein